MDDRPGQTQEKTAPDTGANEKPLPAPGPRSGRSGKVLVVEDERVTQTVLSMVLKSAGYTVLTAKDASAALQVIRTERPDLMTVDIDLSRGAAGEAWDGFRMVEWLWHYHPDDMIPFIVVSAGNPEVFRKRAASLRAFGYLPKPLDKQKLLGLVSDAIGPAPAVPAPAERSAAPPSPPGPETKKPSL